jgi:putative CocE/NonD family hydrolase
VLFDDGADPGHPGAPIPSFEHSFDTWPIPGTVATRWFFADGGALTADPPAEDGADSFAYDATNAQTTTFHGSNGNDIWLSLPPWDWKPLVAGKAVAYATEPLAEDTVMIGSASVDVWFKADAPDVDLQFTLSEIRPDGQEVYVQNGWGRASRRKLDALQSTELRPVATGTEADVEFLPPGSDYVFGRAEIFPFAHAFRAGSRVRISIEPPGGDRPLWQFQALDLQATVDIARSAVHPSSIVLPVIPNVEVPTGLPPCPGLRGQPCRPYVALTNAPAAP